MVMSTNETPVLQARSAYSFCVEGSVHPQTTAALPQSRLASGMK
jgi:hypothetical protein